MADLKMEVEVYGVDRDQAKRVLTAMIVRGMYLLDGIREDFDYKITVDGKVISEYDRDSGQPSRPGLG